MFKKLFIGLLFILFISGSAFAIEFTADTISTYNGHKTSGKIYFKKDKTRMDMESPQEMIAITRLDKKLIWNIMPKEKMYMEFPLKQENKPLVQEKFEGEIERKYIGDETIDGHPTKKYLVKYKVKDNEQQVYQWMATDINFPIKTSAVDGSWSHEYKNIKMEAPDDSLFELPAGYTKIQMPGGMNFKP
jgi:outer membrane lipoprotein-sorting protein